MTALVAVALLTALAPWQAVGTAAQMDQMDQNPSLNHLSGDDFDKAFLMRMSMHHAMAVMMARPAAAQGAHQETKELAQGIIDAQTAELAGMRTWAKEWYGLDLPDHLMMMDQMMGGSMMGGMGDRGMTGAGSGMAKPGGMPMGQMGDMAMMHEMSMMNTLGKLPPRRLEAAFLSLMIPHHQGAIDMAWLVPDRASHQELKDLGQAITRSQGDEIGKMDSWLSSWYGL